VLFAAPAPLGLWLGNGGVEKISLIGSLMLVLIVELLNSAVEAVIDRISEAHHELSGAAKDMGSAAVLMAAGGVYLGCAVVAAARSLGRNRHLPV
jgi:diacylglycerol kinase (ATP)